MKVIEKNNKWYLDYSDNNKELNMITNILNSCYRKIPATQNQVMNYMVDNLNYGMIEFSTLNNWFQIFVSHFFKDAKMREYNYQNIIEFVAKFNPKMDNWDKGNLILYFLSKKFYTYINAFFRDNRLMKQYWDVINRNNYYCLANCLSLVGIIQSPLRTNTAPAPETITGAQGGELTDEEVDQVMKINNIE